MVTRSRSCFGAGHAVEDGARIQCGRPAAPGRQRRGDGRSASARCWGVTVVTVSGGSEAPRRARCRAARRAGRAGGPRRWTSWSWSGAPTVAFVDALSPLLMITAVAIAPIASTAPSTQRSTHRRPARRVPGARPTRTRRPRRRHRRSRHRRSRRTRLRRTSRHRGSPGRGHDLGRSDHQRVSDDSDVTDVKAADGRGAPCWSSWEPIVMCR